MWFYMPSLHRMYPGWLCADGISVSHNSEFLWLRAPNCCNLEHNVLHEQLSGRLKGKPTQTRSSAFIDPVRNLPVSRGSELRLGSLLSAFISVSFTISLSCSPSLSALLPLTPPPLFLPRQHSRPSPVPPALLPQGAGEENVTRSN